jgi:hypothetical protein
VDDGVFEGVCDVFPGCVETTDFLDWNYLTTGRAQVSLEACLGTIVDRYECNAACGPGFEEDVAAYVDAYKAMKTPPAHAHADFSPRKTGRGHQIIFNDQFHQRLGFGFGFDTTPWNDPIAQGRSLSFTHLAFLEVCGAASTHDGPDEDADGVCDFRDGIDDTPLDNCLVANSDQADFDDDGEGDACDIDDDNDGLVDQAEEAVGSDPLDSDSDDDGILDGQESDDGQPFVDTDGDGVPDVLDDDSDGDGVSDRDEAGDDDLRTPPADSNADGTPDFRDPDRDGDSLSDGADNCPDDANADQVDTDQDGEGDTCDLDDDGDGLDDEEDNCPQRANVDQTDQDGDGFGDVCDVIAHIWLPDEDVEIQPNGSNQWLMGGVDIPELFVEADVQIVEASLSGVDGQVWNVRDNEVVIWQLDGLDSPSIVWDPPADPADPSKGLGLEAELRLPGRWIRNEEFGPATLELQVYRDGSVVERAERRVNLFWQVQTDSGSLSWGELKRRPHEFLVNQDLPDTHVEESFLAPFHFNAPDPAWFAYWTSLDPNPFANIFEDVEVRYVQKTFGEGHAGYVRKFDSEVWGWPNNFIQISQAAIALQRFDHQDLPLPEEPIVGIRGFYLAVAHEHCHVEDLLNWSVISRRAHVAHELEELRAKPHFGDPITQFDWHSDQDSLEHTAYYDFHVEPNPQDNEPAPLGTWGFDPGLSCDLDGTPKFFIQESEIGNHGCPGIKEGPQDVDGDGQFTSFIFEDDIENLDLDYDGLPNTYENQVVPAQKDAETRCLLLEQSLLDEVGPELGRLDLLALLDWSRLGENWRD